MVDATVGLGTVVTPKIDERWWQQCGDAQFDELVATALERNPTLQETLARVSLLLAVGSDFTAAS